MDNETLWHQKLFKLDLTFEGAWRILVYYNNGVHKPWWKKTNRSYRFKRWFWLKSPFIFKSLANQNNPEIIIWVFYNWYSRPDKKVIPLEISHLHIEEPLLYQKQPKFETQPIYLPVTNFRPHFEEKNCQILLPSIEIPQTHFKEHQVEFINLDDQNYNAIHIQ
jgi:hypothetical protein